MKSRFLKFNSSHIEYASGFPGKNTTNVYNIKSCLLNIEGARSGFYRADVCCAIVHLLTKSFEEMYVFGEKSFEEMHDFRKNNIEEMHDYGTM